MLASSSSNSNAIHSVAAAGFVDGALYDSARPGFPEECLPHLLPPHLLPSPPSSARIVEVASGTGKFTELLAGRYPHLTAVEPSAAFRATFAERFPNVRCVDGTATQLPVADGAADVVISAQAFHWFDSREAVAEFRRVLAPRGVLALVWNMEDPATPWVRGLREIYEAYDAAAPQYRKGRWRKVFEEVPEVGDWFELPLVHHQVKRTIAVDGVDAIWRRVLSKSYINTLGENEQERVKRTVLDYLATVEFERDAEGRIVYPYITDCFYAVAR
ncbi:S-adenosyl-L-methionine-dependent methyltransferase [Zopfochytrium polystomum]|nr:S-adenosyl-L-methionine-dependent methyltransferase [Zopfochytrium polystomum]